MTENFNTGSRASFQKINSTKQARISSLLNKNTFFLLSIVSKMTISFICYLCEYPYIETNSQE